MSKTLQRLGINIDYFPKEQEREAIEQFTSLRMEQILVGEPPKFSWNNLMLRPELVELNDDKTKNSQFQSEIFQDEDDDQDWPYAENSLFIYGRNNIFRRNLIKVLKQPQTEWITLFFTIANLIALCLYDYQIRITYNMPNIDRIAIGMEIICNIYFGFELIGQVIAQGLILEPKTYLRNGWNFINLFAFLTTWSVLYDNTSDSEFLNACRTIRIFRAARIIQDIAVLKTQMVAFMSSFPKLGAIIIPLLFVLFYYCIVGIHLFMGLTEYRCRMTPEPDFEKQEWLVDPSIQTLCGYWDCPADRYCGSPADYNLPRNLTESDIQAFSYNLNRFDSFPYSLFVVFTFLNVTGWSGTTFFYWHALNTKFTAFFFMTLIFLLAYVLSNLLLASFYESFMVQSSIKHGNKTKQEEEQLENEIQNKRKQQMVERLAAMGETQIGVNQRSRLQTRNSLYFSADEVHSMEEKDLKGKPVRMSIAISKSIYFVIFNSIMVSISTFVLCMDYYGISEKQWQNLQIVDFICMIYFFIELIINLWGKGQRVYFKKIINIFDTLVIISQIVLCFYCYIQEEPLIYNHRQGIELWKALKILRMLKTIYASKMFHTISVLIRCLVETLIKMKFMLLLFITLALIVALFGRELFAYRVRFLGGVDGIYDMKDGESYPVNYDNLGHALMGSFNIFYNEEWHMCMYLYTKANESASIIFFVFAIMFGQVFFLRLLMAIFLNDFCKFLTHVDAQLKPFFENKQVIEAYKTITNVFSRKRGSIKTSPQKADGNQKNLIESASPKEIPYDNGSKDDAIKLGGVMLAKKFNEVADEQMGFKDSDSQNNKQFQQPMPQEDSPLKYRQQSNPNIISPQNEEAGLQEKSIEPSKSQRYSRNNLPSGTPLQVKLCLIVDSKYFKLFNLCLNIATSIRIALKTPTVNPNDTQGQALDILFIILTVLYFIIMIIHMVAKGLFTNENSYFRSTPYNILLFLISIFEIITLILDINHPLAKVVTSLRLMQFIQIGSELNQGIRYAQISLVDSFSKMIQLAFFCLIMFIVYGVFPTKLLKGTLFYCTAIDSSIEASIIINKLDCFDYGGSWVNQILSYDDIFQSICILFITSTTEAWLPILQYTFSAVGVNRQPIQDHNRWWTIYFQFFFFIGFICMLNMFIGIIVNTYQDAKLKAQNLHLLDDTQKEFYSIKKSIMLMRPKAKSKSPNPQIRKFFFKVTKNKTIKRFFILVICFNILILCLYYHRQDNTFREVLDIINIINVSIFTIEILIRLLGKRMDTYFSDFSNTVDIFLIIPCLVNFSIRNDLSYGFQFRRCYNIICVAYQLLRGYRIVKRFNTIEKLFQSIFSVIPSALSMMYIMLIFIFIYTSLGMDMFAYLRPQTYINGFDLTFKNFTSAMFSLVRVASAEQWWALLVDCAKTVQPDFHCIYIDNYDDFEKYGYNGCGTKYAYIYYIFFHMVFSLMILNLFIASVLGAYEEHVKAEESAISKYQLKDVLILWQKYDPDGLGFINYKHFWKLSSEIAIIFGVDQSDLLDENNKKNFLKVLNIPICEHKLTNMLCYKFHDVILSLTKISVTLKYGVANLEPTDPEVVEKIEQNFRECQIKGVDFAETGFSSGNMATIIFIQRKIRVWRKRLKGEKIGDVAGLGGAITKQQK